MRMSTTARRIVFLSSINSTSSIDASLSVIWWDSKLTFSRLNQLVLDQLEHFLVGRAALTHLILVLIEQRADFIVDSMFEIDLRVHDLKDPLRQIQILRYADHFLFLEFFSDFHREQPHVFPS